MSVEHWWSDTDRKTEVLSETPECHFVYYISHMDCCSERLPVECPNRGRCLFLVNILFILLLACIRIYLEEVEWDSRNWISLAQ
jgi:hypothetical protein